MITSFSNQRIKEIRKIRDRKGQKDSPFFFMEGLRIVGEALDQGCQLETLVYAPDLIHNDYGTALVDRCRKAGIELLETDSDVFRSISVKDHPQGVAALGRRVTARLNDLPLTGIIVALMQPADPGNLGTIIRTADAVNATGVILIGESVDPYHISAVRSSMGALFSLPIVKTDFEQFTEWAKQSQLPIIGTSDSAAQDYLEVPIPNPVVLLMGSEREGLTPEQESVTAKMVRIPMMKSSDSLNLAVATGVMLYHIYNAHRGVHWEMRGK